jgi:Holliday junction resolvasome RuvABC endonuclease subunit
MNNNIYHTIKPIQRILSIDPANRGFGFAVMEGPETLIDWGVKEVEDNKVSHYLHRITKLIDLYQPDYLILEAFDNKGSRRCKRVRELIVRIMKLALERKIKIKCYSRDDIRKVFSQYNAFTKHQIATTIASLLPELSPRIPPFRKPWMSEDYRMAIFDAVSFTLTFYYAKNPCY